MKLNSPVTLQPYPFKDKNGNVVLPQPIVLNELDVSYIFRPKSKVIYAQISQVPGLLTLTSNNDINYLYSLSLKDLEELLEIALSDNIQNTLQSLFPKTIESDPDGPGSILSEMLSYIGIKSSPTCACKRHAIEMNEKGPDWCEENIETILGWLKEESTKRKLPFVESVARLVVNRAIKVSRKLKNKKLAKQA
jgi:hypothetical protein